MTDLYRLEIRATSQKQFNTNLTNPLSIQKVNLHVVSDRLFIQFAEQNYYVSTPKILKPPKSTDFLRKYQFNELRNIGDPTTEIQTSDQDYMSRLQDGSIFFSRAHLIQRKLKRNVRFSIDLVQTISKNDQSVRRLPIDSVNTTNLESNMAHELMSNAMNLELDSDRVNLFDIDSYTGKIYINREYLSDMEYEYGDIFILTVVATAYEPNSNTVLSKLENTVTRLFVRITERDYSLIMPVTNSLHSLLTVNMNPLKELYIPRLLEADGVECTIQDLVLVKTDKNVNRMDESLYNVIIQLENNRDNKPCSLDKFANIWQNFSISPVYFNNFDRLEERSFNRRDQNEEDLAFLKIPRESPFYFNWLFWFLIISTLLVLIIAMFCLNCYCLKKAIKKTSKQSGLVIEYPPGYTPSYDDGVLNLNNKKVSSNFEEQELMMEIEDDFDKTIN